MEKRFVIVSILILIFSFYLPYQANAEWKIDGTEVCTTPEAQYNPRIISTGNGEIIIVWEDGRNQNLDIYAQKLDTLGIAMWVDNGISVSNENWKEKRPNIVPDGNGGAIISWIDDRYTGYGEIFAKRINASGNSLWNESGVAVCTVDGAFDYGNSISMISDGNGGAIICWEDSRNGNDDIFAQRIDSNGITLWAENGQAICTETGRQFEPNIVSDGNGGAIICWEDERSGDDIDDIYGQHISASGNILWTENGIPISNTDDDQGYNQVIADGNHGAIICWKNITTNEIFAQRIDGGGSALWTHNGINISETNIEFWCGGPLITDDDNGGAIICWKEKEYEYNYYFYIEKLDSLGNTIWNKKQISIPTFLASIIEYPKIIHDGYGGAYIIATVSYNQEDYDLYIWKIENGGENELNGLICGVSGEQEVCELTRNGNNDLFLVWQDYREGNNNEDIYSQRITSDLEWPRPSPEIQGIDDIINDEGGWIRINVYSSEYDNYVNTPPVNYPVYGYNIWRKISIATSNIDRANDKLDRKKVYELISGNGFNNIIILENQCSNLGFPPGNWESLGFHSSNQQDEYNFCIGTLKDSTENDNAVEEFIVTAHTNYPSVYFVSNIATGYSVDNLAPDKPTKLSGFQSTDPDGLEINWHSNTERDLSHYLLYRNTSQNFNPTSQNQLTKTTEASYFDDEWTKESGFYYKLSAVDRHGNKSSPAELVPDDVVKTLLQSFSIHRDGFAIELSWQLSRYEDESEFLISRYKKSEGDHEYLTSGKIIRDNLSFRYKDSSCLPDESYRYRIEILNGNNNNILFETRFVSIPAMPLTLYQNYPNPFNPSTAIEFYLPNRSNVKLTIYDVSGKQVRTLIEKNMGKGFHSVNWTGTDNRGNRLSSGIYFYRLNTGTKSITRKMILVR